ncbi:MAG TPA: hypothetical protein ENN84_03660 [Candidatus Marinimicrobia bacterium]|nr:hypothetical protein [Candidatus Neomarinimicrobiota bacterium]
MLNKIKIELDDEQLQELREVLKKIESAKEPFQIKPNGTMRGMAKVVLKELLIYDDFKKRDQW